MNAAIILQRICLFIAFVFALVLIYVNSDWIKLRGMALQAYFIDAPTETDYRVEFGSIEGEELRLWIADTEEKRERGFSGFPLISYTQGMLFVFPYPQRPGIWMKDMLFSLDILWLNEELEVVYAAPNVSPLTFPQVFTPDTDALYVLELKAGSIERSNIQYGSKLDLIR